MLPQPPHTSWRTLRSKNPSAHQTRDPGVSLCNCTERNTNALGSDPRGCCPSHLRPFISTESDSTEAPPVQSKKGPRKRANIKITMLNMNGAHTGSESQTSFEKWSEINATMKKERIAILAIQETHLDEQSLNDVNRLFGKRLSIHNSPDATNPRSTAGVAFAINKDLHWGKPPMLARGNPNKLSLNFEIIYVIMISLPQTKIVLIRCKLDVKH